MNKLLVQYLAMILYTQDDVLVFGTEHGTLTMAQMAREVRLKAGFKTCGGFEYAMGIDHPKWYDIERGRWKTVQLLLTTMIELGYTITISKGE